MPSLPDLTLPDPRRFTAGHVYLLEWCAAQPERSTAEKVAELARMAGCSPFNMQQVLVGKRALSVRCARALVGRLELEPEAAEHLLKRTDEGDAYLLTAVAPPG